MSLFKRIRSFRSKPPEQQRRILRYLLSRAVYLLVSRSLGSLTGLLWLICWGLAEPFSPQRIAKVHSLRIGHLALNVDLYLRRRQLGQVGQESANYRFVCDSGQLANPELVRLWQQQIDLSTSLFWRGLLWLSGWMIEGTRFWVPLPMNSVEYEPFNEAPPTLDFNRADQARGEEGLRAMGLDPQKDRFVCLFARDSGYLKKILPEADWACHECRNSDIATFDLLVDWLLEQGFYVLRMGTHVEVPFQVEHERYIDYAQQFRDPFLDLYLCAHAYAFIGSASGLGDVTNLFDTPRLQLDCIPFGFIPFGKQQMSLPKRVVRLDTREPVPYAEIIQKGLEFQHNGVLFNRAGYDYVDNTPQEKLAATKELLRWIQDPQGAFSPEEQALIKAARELFPPGNPAREIKNPISPSFIAQNKALFGLD